MSKLLPKHKPKLYYQSTLEKPSENIVPIHLKVVGIVQNASFQRARQYALTFHKHLPNKFSTPEIIPYMGIEWNQYITKCRRRFGGKFYELTKPVAVYVNETFLGDDEALVKYMSKDYQISLCRDFENDAARHLYKIFDDTKRTHIYMNICIDDVMIGSFVIRLYTDLLPKTCANFIRLATCKHRGYNGAPIHRIQKSSWIQVGGFNLKRGKIPCENYCIPHDRRGVLSMCNDGKNRKNSTQFCISLNATPWMDYKYVAFGQLIDGEKTLAEIEKVPTYYEAPTKKITIRCCGIYSFDEPENRHQIKYLNCKLNQAIKEETDEMGQTIKHYKLPRDKLDNRDEPSIMNVINYIKGLYFHPLDPYSENDILPMLGINTNVEDIRDQPSMTMFHPTDDRIVFSEVVKRPDRYYMRQLFDYLLKRGLVEDTSIKIEDRDQMSVFNVINYIKGLYFHELDQCSEIVKMIGVTTDIVDVRDVSSDLQENRYLEGLYNMGDDLVYPYPTRDPGDLKNKEFEVLSEIIWRSDFT